LKLKIIPTGWGVILKRGDVMRARNGRDRRARKGRYFLRDLAGFADVERLLAIDRIGERLLTDAADGDAPADVIAPSAAPRPQPAGGSRKRT
jgi:hypothetical protein